MARGLPGASPLCAIRHISPNSMFQGVQPRVNAFFHERVCACFIPEALYVRNTSSATRNPQTADASIRYPPHAQSPLRISLTDDRSDSRATPHIFRQDSKAFPLSHLYL